MAGGTAASVRLPTIDPLTAATAERHRLVMATAIFAISLMPRWPRRALGTPSWYRDPQLITTKNKIINAAYNPVIVQVIAACSNTELILILELCLTPSTELVFFDKKFIK